MLYFFPLKYFFMRCKTGQIIIWFVGLCCCPPPFLTLIINDVITWSTVYMLFYPILQHNKLTHIKLKYLLCAILSLLCFLSLCYFNPESKHFGSWSRYVTEIVNELVSSWMSFAPSSGRSLGLRVSLDICFLRIILF